MYSENHVTVGNYVYTNTQLIYSGIDVDSLLRYESPMKTNVSRGQKEFTDEFPANIISGTEHNFGERIRKSGPRTVYGKQITDVTAIKHCASIAVTVNNTYPGRGGGHAASIFPRNFPPRNYCGNVISALST